METFLTRLFCLLSFFFITSCNQIDKLLGNKPYLELTNTNELTITEFTWGYGTIAFNQFSGDFEKLDKKVFELLKGKEGVYKVYLQNNEKDQYGKENDSTIYVGDLDLAELNKYEGWTYWHKHAGIKALLYKKFVKAEVRPLADASQPEVETAVLTSQPFVEEEVTDSVGSSGETYRWNKKTRSYDVISPKTTKTFSLEQTDLYPDPEERANQDYQSYTDRITGTIKAADFYHGTLEVQGDDGEYYALRLIPDNLPTSLKSDVRYFMKTGNRISCICTVAGARELEIVSVTFTSSQ